MVQVKNQTILSFNMYIYVTVTTELLKFNFLSTTKKDVWLQQVNIRQYCSQKLLSITVEANLKIGIVCQNYSPANWYDWTSSQLSLCDQF